MTAKSCKIKYFFRVVVIGILSTMIMACQDPDVTPPAQITDKDITFDIQTNSISFWFYEPSDSDYAYTIITINDSSFEDVKLEKGSNWCGYYGLKSDTEYVLSFTTYDKTGNASEVYSIKKTTLKEEKTDDTDEVTDDTTDTDDNDKDKEVTDDTDDKTEDKDDKVADDDDKSSDTTDTDDKTEDDKNDEKQDNSDENTVDDESDSDANTNSSTDLSDVSDFNAIGFGKDGEINSSWTVTGKATYSSYNDKVKPALTEVTGDPDKDGYALKFSYRYLGTNTASIKKNITISDDRTLCFFVKTDIYYEYDGYLCFYVDNQKIDSYTGENGEWTKYSYDITAGTHTIEWRAEGASTSYTKSITNTVYVDSLQLKAATVYPSTIDVDFEDSLDESIWTGSGIIADIIDKDPIYANWKQYGDALVDTHGKVYQLATYNSTKKTRGTSSLKITVNPSVDSTLSFEYKTDLWTSNLFTVSVDDEEKLSTTNCGTEWLQASVDVAAGKHVILLSVSSPDGYVGAGSITNSVYLDNFSLIADEMSSVSVYPKGVQETYIGGNTIQFSAKALRSDGSEISGKTVTWSTNGGTIDSDGLFTPGNTAGTYTVTATIDGKTALNQTVKVHSESYLQDSVTLAGKTFTGEISDGSGNYPCTTNCAFYDPTPGYTTFSADGFFVLKGNTTVDLFIQIKKDSYVTYYFIPSGYFEQRIWLRFGEGDYTIFITELSSLDYYTAADGYQGDLRSFGTYYTEGPTTCTLNVTNTNDTYSAEEASYLLPSYWCQLDDFRITNAFNGIMAELPEDATIGLKLAAIHDWEIHRMYYDNASLGDERKTQDAVHVLEYEMGVCEGYANLYSAIARLAGVESTVICAQYIGHAWNNVYYNGKWLLLDATWDDPISSTDVSNVEINPLSENYTYFLLTSAQDRATGYDHGEKAICAGNAADYSVWIGGDYVNNMRTVDGDTDYAPYINGLPNGWY